MRPLTPVFTPVLAIAALIAAIPVSAATTHGKTLDFVERADSDTISVKGGTAADNVGDIMTFTNPIYDAANATKMGSDQGYCVRLIAGKSFECHWTMTIGGGQIMVDGPVADTGDTVLAVTGGTGAYAGARGDMLIHARDAKATAYDFHYHLQ